MELNATLEYTIQSEQTTVPCNTARVVAPPRHKRNLGIRILVVDDEPEVVRALSMRLSNEGYEVSAARDGATATQAAIETQPDLIILDIGLPCGDGHAVARRLTDHVNTLFVPVIFLTARTAQVDKNKAKYVGASDYITKPYTSETLLSSVRRALMTSEADFS